MKTKIYFLFVSILLFFNNEVNAQRRFAIRDSTTYIINNIDTIVASKYKLYKKQGSSLNLIVEFNETLGWSPVIGGVFVDSTRAWIRDFDFWDSQNWYVLLGWEYDGGSTILYKTNDAGVNWTIDTSYYSASQYQSINQVQIVNNQKAFLFDDYYFSDVLRTSDGGNTWERWLKGNMFSHHYGIFICNDSTYYLWGRPGDPWNPYMIKVPANAFGNLNYQLDCFSCAPNYPDAYFYNGVDGYQIDNENYFAPIFDSLCSQVLSVAELNLKKQIVIYPNPNNGKFTFLLNDTEYKNGTIEIYNVLGEKIYQTVVVNEKSEIDFSCAAIKGVYFVKLINGQSITTKIIIVN